MKPSTSFPCLSRLTSVCQICGTITIIATPAETPYTEDCDFTLPKGYSTYSNPYFVKFRYLAIILENASLQTQKNCIQVYLRRKYYSTYAESDSDLFQWKSGSKFCNVDLESLITLNEDDNGRQYVEVKVRGPSHSTHGCFHFMDDIMRAIRRVSITNKNFLTVTCADCKVLRVYCNFIA